MAYIQPLVPLLMLFALTQTQPDTPVMEFEVEEESPIGNFVGDIGEYVLDRYDQSILDQIQFGFLPQPHQDISYFNLDTDKGFLRLAKPIDRDDLCPTMKQCHLDIDVAIVRPINYFQMLPIRVKILDINDNPPQFPEKDFPVSLSESSSVGTRISLPIALDKDSPTNGVKGYRLLTDNGKFELRTTSNSRGLVDLELELVSKLDRETEDEYKLEVEVYDGGSPSLSTTVAILVTVEDANDHSPVFRNSSYTVQIPEDFPLDDAFFTVEATDLDTGLNGQIIYKFAPRTSSLFSKQFGLREDSGEVYLKQELDFEGKREYQLDIVATDRGPNSKAASCSLKLLVLDVNDNSPLVTINTLTEHKEARVPENASPATFVAYVSVFDSDQGRNGEVVCDINNHDDFYLNSIQRNQFKIETAFMLDREEVAQYHLQVLCMDLGEPELTSSANLTVIVLDENDHTPTFSKSSYTAVLPENNEQDAYIMQLNATDLDSGPNGNIHFEIMESITQYAYIHPSSGVVRASSRFDYEATKKLVFTVRVTDKGNPPRSSTAHVSINILDLNDEAPRFELNRYAFNVYENQLKYSRVGQVAATDKDSDPYNRFIFSIEELENHGTFAIDPDTGEIKTLEILDREQKDMYYMTVLATDRDNHALVGSTMVEVKVEDVNDNFPVIDYPTRDNNTFSISNQVPRGHGILQVRASDRDDSYNARLSYSITSGNSYAVFTMNVTSGHLSTKTTFEGIQYEEHDLTITVQDHGYPAKTSSMEIRIIIDENTPYYARKTDEESSMVTGNNLFIIIIVASISGFIMVVLIIAIIAMKLYDRRRPTSIYKCRVEEEKILRKAAMMESGRGSRDGTLRSCGSGSLDRKMGDNGDKKKAHGAQKGPGSWENNGAPLPDNYVVNHGPDQHLEAHLLALLKQDRGDTESASSAEMSNADSGRGPSEEGEQTYHPSSRHAYPSNYGPSHTFSTKNNLSTPVYVHPQRKGVQLHSPNQRSLSEQDINHKPPHSSAIKKVPPSSARGPAATQLNTQPTRGSFHCLVREEQERQGKQPNNINKNNSPKKILTTFQSPPSYEAVVREEGEDKKKSDSSKNDLNSGCHDNHVKTDPHAPNNLHQTDTLHNIAEEEDCDDLNEDSNHSDVVDPQELCQEIDNLFFKSVVV